MPPEIPPTATFLQFLVDLHPDAQWVTQQVEISGDWDTWANGDRHRLQGVRKTSEINPSFKRFVDKNLRVRDVLQRAGPTNRIPTNAEGIEMCLSYHLKGVCNTNCARNGDHKDHSTDEDAKIVRWCDTHYKEE
jgi:hypothetical protein